MYVWTCVKVYVSLCMYECPYVPWQIKIKVLIYTYGKMKYDEEAKRGEETPTSTQRDDEMGKIPSSEDNDDEEK